MPPNSGMAFVVILHLSEQYESNLAEILQKATAMPVAQVKETLQVEPDRVRNTGVIFGRSSRSISEVPVVALKVRSRK
jgi:hypothetical protein